MSSGFMPCQLSWRAITILLEHRDAPNHKLPVDLKNPPRQKCIQSLIIRGYLRFHESSRSTSITAEGTRVYWHAVEMWLEMLLRDQRTADRIQELMAQIMQMKAAKRLPVIVKPAEQAFSQSHDFAT